MADLTIDQYDQLQELLQQKLATNNPYTQQTTNPYYSGQVGIATTTTSGGWATANYPQQAAQTFQAEELMNKHREFDVLQFREKKAGTIQKIIGTFLDNQSFMCKETEWLK
jgi:hypothetical protein